MGIYSATGALKVTVNDTLNKGRYAADGSVRVTVVPGTAYTGLYAADGSMNVVIEDGFLYHPCGALRGKAALTTYTGLSSPFGALYMDGLTISFDPSQLFAAAEVGGWYDPSDLTTLYQNAAGTIPVTAVEQPVGLLLDKSKGLVLGSELAPGGGTFDSATGWAQETGWTVSGGVATAASGALRLYTGAILTLEATYLVTVTVTSFTTTGTVYLGANVSGGLTLSGAGTFTGRLRCLVNTRLYVGNGFVGTIDNISVRELPGNHLTQSTAASRPVLSARVNLLLNTPFSGAVSGTPGTNPTSWTSTITGGTLTAATNTIRVAVTAARHNLRQLYTAPVNSTVLFRVAVNAYVSSQIREIITVAALPAGAAISSYVMDGVDVTATQSISGEHIIGVRYTVGATAGSASHQIGGGLQANQTSDVLFYEPDLRIVGDAAFSPAYQRVTTSSDYDTVGFPLYLKFDGTDDFLQSSTITPGSVDKVQVFAGVRKLSDAARGMIVEANTSYAVSGTFGITGPDAAASASYGFFLNGSQITGSQATTYTSPITNVLSVQFDIAASTRVEEVIPAINGQLPTVSGQGAPNAGTGNFVSSGIYVGRRGGTTSPFNGHLYSLIVRFSAANLNAATILDTETWVNGKTGAY